MNGIIAEANTMNNNVIRLSLKKVSFRIIKRKNKYNRLKINVDFNRNNNQLFIFFVFTGFSLTN